MPGRKLQLGVPAVAAIIDELFNKEKHPKIKHRFRIIRLTASGKYLAQEIADICGCSRATVFNHVKAVREGGLDAISSINGGGRAEGWRKGISDEVSKEFQRKLFNHEFITLQDARRWLFESHQIEVSYNRIWYWAKKLGGVLKVPRPSHSKKDPAASDFFKKDLTSKLEGLDLPKQSRAKIWVMDEARFGLHTMLRRVWSERGVRPVVTHQMKYEWDYLYGSLEVTTGESHFCQIPGVNLEWHQKYLEDLSASDPDAIHIVIQDGAGFHLRNGDERVPSNVRLIELPPYSPELNPCEQLWDLVKDAMGNTVYQTVEDLRKAMTKVLKTWWQTPAKVISLIGRPWLRDQANAS